MLLTTCQPTNEDQDNDNTEMMTHLEGPIVDCIWDTFLVSWHKAMTPQPPYLDRTAASLPTPTFQESSFTSMFNEQGQFRMPESGPSGAQLQEHMPVRHNTMTAYQARSEECTLFSRLDILAKLKSTSLPAT